MIILHILYYIMYFITYSKNGKKLVLYKLEQEDMPTKKKIVLLKRMTTI